MKLSLICNLKVEKSKLKIKNNQNYNRKLELSVLNSEIKISHNRNGKLE